jgi:acyl-CoA thioesterase
MFEFDEDTQLTAIAPGHERGRITDRFNVGPIPNGGYVASIGLRALQRSLPALAPLTLTAHYLRPARPGPVDVHVDVIKQGKRYATATARLLQEGGEIARLLATFGTLSPDAEGALVLVRVAPPSLPPIAEARQLPRLEPLAILRRFDILVDPKANRMLGGDGSGEAEIAGYTRFADGRPPDVASLPLYADGMPPALFNVATLGWVPTLELTVHIRKAPVPGWLRTTFRTRFVFGGLFEEDGEIWDESGSLVAQSRQLAQLPRR